MAAPAKATGTGLIKTTILTKKIQNIYINSELKRQYL